MKVFILTTVMAPYRVQLFSEIGKHCDLYVCFEQMRSAERNDNWYDEGSANFHLVKLEKWNTSLHTIKWETVKHVRTIRPDVVIAYEYHTRTSLVLLSYCQAKQIPYIINCDGAFIKKSIKDVVKKLYISKAKGFISSGRMANEYLLNYGAIESRIHFNHFTSLHEKNILDKISSLEEKNLARRDNGIAEQQVILAVGQFVHRKGFDVLLKAAADFSREIGVYIIGGKVTPEYKQIVNEFNLENVHFIDFMAPEELRRYYIAADLFVLPTREDVWGLVINEAMACALPVVTTDRCVAGVEMIKNDINGYIVPTENPDELYHAVDKILSDDVKRKNMASENLKTIRDYTYENSAQDIMLAIKAVHDSFGKGAEVN